MIFEPEKTYSRFSDPIHGDKFVALADYAIEQNDSPIDADALLSSENRLIFIKTDRIREAFQILQERSYPVRIITHNSDHNITENVVQLRPTCVTHWYAQNCLVYDRDIIPIPIGLERPGIGQSGDYELMEEIQEDYGRSWMERPCRVYYNFAIGTNPNVRKKWMDDLDPEKSFIQNKRIPFAQYLQELMSVQYSACPPGNGHDTHRLWESLYMGTIPMVEESSANNFFAHQWKLVGSRMLVFEFWKEMILNPYA